MVIAALVCFTILLIAWLLAPGPPAHGRARRRRPRGRADAAARGRLSGVAAGRHRVAGTVEERPRLPWHVPMAPMQDPEDLVLEPSHPLLLVDLGVVVAEQVQGAVNREQDELLGDAPVALGRLAQRLVEVDHHVAEQERTRRGDAVVIGQV